MRGRKQAGAHHPHRGGEGIGAKGISDILVPHRPRVLAGIASSWPRAFAGRRTAPDPRTRPRCRLANAEGSTTRKPRSSCQRRSKRCRNRGLVQASMVKAHLVKGAQLLRNGCRELQVRGRLRIRRYVSSTDDNPKRHAYPQPRLQQSRAPYRLAPKHNPGGFGYRPRRFRHVGRFRGVSDYTRRIRLQIRRHQETTWPRTDHTRAVASSSNSPRSMMPSSTPALGHNLGYGARTCLLQRRFVGGTDRRTWDKGLIGLPAVTAVKGGNQLTSASTTSTASSRATTRDTAAAPAALGQPDRSLPRSALIAAHRRSFRRQRHLCRQERRHHRSRSRRHLQVAARGGRRPVSEVECL